MKIPQKLFALCLLFLFVYLPAGAQDYDNYLPMECQGEIPKEFLTRSSVKFEKQKGELTDLGTSKERKAQEEFLLKSNFVIDELLLSGKVLFNDPVSAYIATVKDFILRDMPEIKDKIRIYLVKSPSVNAFCTNDGIVLVNMGLIAQLESEAQLAFVLAHEVQHYIKQHPLDKYVETEKIRSNRLYNSWSFEKRILAKNQYSRELEVEADRMGLDLYLNTPYNTDVIDGVFDVLQYSYLPFDDLPIKKEFFETSSLKFPESLQLDTVQAISTEYEYDEKHSTHPSIDKRREMVAEVLAGGKAKPGPTSIFGEDRFSDLRKRCRFELSSLYVQNKQYESSIYNSYLLSQEHPKSKYLRKNIAQSLYGLTRYRNERNFYEVHRDYEKIEGESQSLYFLIEKMNKDELNVLAIAYAWDAFQKNQTDQELSDMVDDLLTDFWEFHKETAEGMATEAKPVEKKSDQPDQEEEKEEEDFENMSKYDKIKAKQKEKEEDEAERDDFARYAFVKYFQDPDFLDRFEAAKKEMVDRGEIEYYSSWERNRLAKKRKLKGQSLGIEKVVFVSPIYKKIDERKSVPVEYIASEKSLSEFNAMIEENASSLGLNYEMLEPSSLRGPDTDKFNDIATLKDWMGDYFSNDEVPMINVRQDQARALVEKYKTPYFAWTGSFIVTKKRNPSTTALVICSAFLVYPLPYVIYYFLKPQTGTYYVNLVFNIESGEMKMGELRYISMKDRKPILKSAIYNSLLQMKTSPRK